jgi:beta-phosphoglucomutase-like phosphatase (HAD superfamily)
MQSSNYHVGEQALLFDCDGVLVDTEAAGHRVSFNEAFKRKGEGVPLGCMQDRLAMLGMMVLDDVCV